MNADLTDATIYKECELLERVNADELKIRSSILGEFLRADGF